MPARDSEERSTVGFEGLEAIHPEQDAVQGESEAAGRLRALIDNLGVGVFRIDNRSGKVLEANPAYARILGYPSLEAALGSSVLDHYDDPKERAETFARFLANPEFRRQGMIRFEAVRIRQGSGEPVHVLISVSVTRDESGAITHIDGLLEDIGERKRAEKAFAASERRFRMLFEHAGVGMVITDPDGIVTRVNRAFADFAGRGEADLAGRPFETFVHPDDAERARRWLSLGGVRSSDVSSTRSWRFRHPAGDTRWGMVTRTWLRSDDGGLSTTVLMVQDVTLLERMEEEVQRTKRLESLGVLAGGIAHDFNNSLAVVFGSLDLAQMADQDEEARSALLAQAAQGAERARTLTAKLMTFAKGGHPIRRLTSIEQLLRESVGSCPKNGEITVTYEIEPGLPPVEVDRTQMGQVFASLVRNATQAMTDRGRVVIRASVVSLDEESPVPLPTGRYVRVDVIDDGVGIPTENLKSIFDPFFSKGDKGAGLGLSIAHSVVTRHGGHISVESAVGVGSTVSVYLAEATSAAETVADEAARLAATVRRGRVLVMDDESGVQRVARAMLSACGLEADVVRDGAAAISAFAEAAEAGRPYAAVILDLTVPGGLGGAEIIDRLHQIDPAVRAIVSSGYSTSPVLTDYRGHGFAGVLPKPYSLTSLRATLREVLGIDTDASVAG